MEKECNKSHVISFCGKIHETIYSSYNSLRKVLAGQKRKEDGNPVEYGEECFP